METRTFLPYEPDQILLLPPSLREWLPAGRDEDQSERVET